ncbi:BlaI/MecI/CopY family transcriptional regulator [Bacillus salipaludis]|uniref:BlaI/MecI/CopY family transcriptional regulator n=1 Tax=Bacillus salipaludis TaxID=2547811 RepID=A0A4R5VSJ9_9BACI|nr:BlaI/MecI/CopY family transcriptional regulator [Bacillus salipaludis]TDK61758.1 BlaI/MecI/CopY family transcriptional regulator [Bacillus salipaludis]
MEKYIPKISEAELEIMKVLWEKSPQTANEVIENLESKMDWKPKTIRTLINRLVQKEAVSYHQRNGRMYEYYPLVSQDSFIQVETKSLLKRFYGASLKPLLVNFLKEEKLSSEDIRELKRILDEKNEENLRKDIKND